MLSNKAGTFQWMIAMLWLVPVLSWAGCEPWVAYSYETTSIREPILPIPEKVNVAPEKVELGRRLFSDKRLSSDGLTSCSSCHQSRLDSIGQTNLSRPIEGKHYSTHAPAIFNVGLSQLFGWYGDRSSLGAVVEAMVKGKKGLASNWGDIIQYLEADPQYSKKFEKLYPGGIQSESIKDALSEFMCGLLTPNSRFDQFLRGDLHAITDDEKEGYRKFKSYGCVSCHQGVLVGGNMVASLNMFNKKSAKISNGIEPLGRFNHTKKRRDKYVFRVTGLRNVALTAPYFHDGSVETLEEAVELMNTLMTGRESIPPDDRGLIVKFLHTLTGENREGAW